MKKSTGNAFEVSPPARRRKAHRRAGSWRRPSRPLERWESDHEPYPAATVLADLDQVGTDAAAATAVLARFATVQLVLLATAGVLSGEALIAEREVALSYLADTSAFSAAEREALVSALRHADAGPDPALAVTLVAAGAAAEARGHGAGAWGCYRSAYQLAQATGWPAEGAAAARAISTLAAAAGGTRSAQLWKRRAQSLDALRSAQ